LAHVRRDLELTELRGNVPTRIERLNEGRYDAIVLAAAGLKRLGLEQHVSAYLPTDQFPPAVSQGAIAVVRRAEDGEAAHWRAALDHRATRLATAAERALLRHVEGGCQVPLGALASVDLERIRLQAAVCALDGSMRIAAHAEAALGDDGDAAAV